MSNFFMPSTSAASLVTSIWLLRSGTTSYWMPMKSALPSLETLAPGSMGQRETAPWVVMTATDWASMSSESLVSTLALVIPWRSASASRASCSLRISFGSVFRASQAPELIHSARVFRATWRLLEMERADSPASYKAFALALMRASLATGGACEENQEENEGAGAEESGEVTEGMLDCPGHRPNVLRLACCALPQVVLQLYYDVSVYEGAQASPVSIRGRGIYPAAHYPLWIG